MDAEELKKRSKEFAKRIIKLCRTLRGTQEKFLIRGQLFRCGTSVGANYRAACRGRSRADFVSKLGIVLEEADESLYWMEILCETTIIRTDLLEPLMNEARELIAIFVASLNTARSRGLKAHFNLQSAI